MPKTRVLIVDIHPLFRDGLTAWLDCQSGLGCCGYVETLHALRSAIPELRPGLVVSDLRLRDCSALDHVQELSETHPELPLLVLSELDENVYAHRAIRAGARGYVMKWEPQDVVLAAIQTVLRGEIYVSRSVAARVLDNLFPNPASTDPELARLSDRELQVFQLIGVGCRNREIAAKLKISAKTVETHRENVKQKLGMEGTEDLLLAASQWISSGKFNMPAANGRRFAGLPAGTR
jgi:DNA-binding NarL/FixJ family response regulator